MVGPGGVSSVRVGEKTGWTVRKLKNPKKKSANLDENRKPGIFAAAHKTIEITTGQTLPVSCNRILNRGMVVA